MEPAKALDRAIAAKDVRRALLCFDAMQEPAVITTVQRLAILLAKQKTAPETRRAFEILRSVFAMSLVQDDDFTQLASILVVEACVRHHMTREAIEICEQAHKRGFGLDLHSYDVLLEEIADDACVIDHAVSILQHVVDSQIVGLRESAFQPVLFQLARGGRFDKVIELIDLGRRRDVVFSVETYDHLLEISEGCQDEEIMQRFLNYLNGVLEQDKLVNSFGLPEGAEIDLAIADEDSDDDIDSEADDDTSDENEDEDLSRPH